MRRKIQAKGEIYLYNKSTYTFEELKQSVYKALDEYSVNGNETSLSFGNASDIEKKFISALNRCARRVELTLPLLEKTVQLEIIHENGECKCALPQDFGKVRFFDAGSGLLKENTGYTTDENYIYFKGSAQNTAKLSYFARVNRFSDETQADERINLPDVTADALVFLTAAELCPAEYSETYSKLIYAYKDIALNCYNMTENKSCRNTFYAPSNKRLGGLADGIR